jgi:hypothetical protein
VFIDLLLIVIAYAGPPNLNYHAKYQCQSCFGAMRYFDFYIGAFDPIRLAWNVKLRDFADVYHTFSNGIKKAHLP